MSNRAESIVNEYLAELEQQFATGEAREHAYRPALKRFMEEFEDLIAVNDPKRSDHGNPDFVFLQKSNSQIIKGYAEAKDIDKDLDKEEGSEQMERYGGYANLFLTNYLDFRFFKNGEKYKTISLGAVANGKLELSRDKGEALVREITEFIALPPEKIKSGRRLAEIMGAKARRVRDDVEVFLDEADPDDELPRIFTMMRDRLVAGIEKAKFADMYAQTLVYGLFVARFADATQQSFSRQEARDLVPKSNPFLRSFFDHIAGPSFDERLGYIVDELSDVFRVSDVHAIVSKHLNVAKVSASEKDPIIHFYEDFLASYDAEVKRAMGAYYTPVPVVRFIVSNVDKLLREHFAISDGLASTDTVTYTPKTASHLLTEEAKAALAETAEPTEVPRVQVLDPATGTATFLNEVIKFIHGQFEGQEGRWPKYVNEHLLPRLFGFELMMAPYTVAHLKLGMTLSETGARASDGRLNVYLTNTLQEGTPSQPGLFSFGLSEAVTAESQLASEVKENKPVMVVLGNPPYSAASSNRTSFANRLVQKYKVEPGGFAKLNEQKEWLNDDYVKFISFAENMVERTGYGIMAMITNNGYLDNPTFRGMRWHLAKTFDHIYVVNLHGNANKKETSPDGTKDENVFQIRQGVGIILAVKTGESTAPASVSYTELFGKRSAKFSALLNEDLTWTDVELDKEYYYFVPQTTEGKDVYEKGIPVDKLFKLGSTGIVTRGDGFIIDANKAEITARVAKLASGGYTADSLTAGFSVGKGYAPFVMKGATKLKFEAKKVIKVGYRPFDTRYTYFDNKVLWRWREEVMKNLILEDSLGLVTTRLQKQHPGAFITANPITHKVFNSYDSNSVFPLYVTDEHGERVANLDAKQLQLLSANLVHTPSPENVLDYAYGVLYSPAYRETYASFLAQNFPRLPMPSGDAEFKHFVQHGHSLRKLHLMDPAVLPKPETTFPVGGTDVVSEVRFEEGRVYINPTQYFGNVPDVAWEMHVGGYRPAYQWLRDRLGHALSNVDMTHYQRIITVLAETDRIMAEIDVLD